MPFSDFAIWFFGPASTYLLARLALRRGAHYSSAARRSLSIDDRTWSP
jgi:hypothetical protein